MSRLVNPMRVFAVQGVASLAVPRTDAEKKKLRTALLTVLGAADLDTDGIGDKPTASNKEFAEHTLVLWYDVDADALRLFAPTPKVIDETTTRALDLLHGSVHADLRALPIEDLDAVARVLALMSAGGSDAADLHARLVAPNLGRYDDDFVPPTPADLAALWGIWWPYYLGGTSVKPGPVEAWITRAYAFGSGPLPEAAKTKAKAAAKPKAKAAAPKKAKAKAKAKPAKKASPKR